MTRRELNEIFNRTRRTQYVPIPLKQVEELIKDLQILEVLKRAVINDDLFKLDDDGVGNNHKYILVDYDSYHASSITSYEYDLLKEWLEC